MFDEHKHDHTHTHTEPHPYEHSHEHGHLDDGSAAEDHHAIETPDPEPNAEDKPRKGLWWDDAE